MSRRNILGSRRGTTLVEILVTMVVLLIGIMTIVQMFPTGFGVVRSAESMTIATKLAQAELEKWKTNSVNLPTGIVPIDANGNILNDQYPGPPFKATYQDDNGELLGPNSKMYTRGNVLNIRQIIGETTRIPVGSYFSTAVGSSYGARYALAFGPIDVKPKPTGGFDGLAIKSGDLRRRSGSQEYYPPDLKLGEYAIDYGDGSGNQFYVAFPRDPSVPNRLYYISYSYWATDDSTQQNELISVLNQEISAPGDQGDWIPVIVAVPAGYTFSEIEDRTDSCARGFIEVVGPWPPDDPYTFALADNILGVVSFNPIGRGMYEYTAQGVRPIEARIDYRILDPRIIREDKVVPQPETGATEIPMKMALRFILDIDDATDNPDEPTYQGMAPNAGIPESVLMIDLSTGMRVDMANVTVDYKAGVINLPLDASLMRWDGTATVAVGAPVPLAGRQLRFFYRADGDWTVQCHKAYALYARERGSSALDHCHYRTSDGGPPNRLYFAVCEAEKTVAVDYTYTDPTDGAERKVVGESHRISDSADSTDLHYIDLNLPPASSLRRVYAVVGTSFKVRVIWRDSKAWRYVDLDTNLTRGQ